jgi:hypothetical protein
LYQPWMVYGDGFEATDGMNGWQGKPSTQSKPGPVPLCPPHTPHGLTRSSNPGPRGGKPATDRLSYGKAIIQHYENRSHQWQAENHIICAYMNILQGGNTSESNNDMSWRMVSSGLLRRENLKSYNDMSWPG